MSAEQQSAAPVSAHDTFIIGMGARAEATCVLRAALCQSTHWVAGGRKHAIATMEPRYAANIGRFIERRARQLYDGECAAWLFLPEPNGEQAGYAFEDEVTWLHERTPEQWLADQPLMQALKARAGDAKPGPSRRWRLTHPLGSLRRALR